MMRWTAPAATECAVDLLFTGCDTTTTVATAYAGGVLFADGAISQNGDEAYGSTVVTLEAGQTIDLLVDANGDRYWDSTCVDAFLTCR